MEKRTCFNDSTISQSRWTGREIEGINTLIHLGVFVTKFSPEVKRSGVHQSTFPWHCCWGVLFSGMNPVGCMVRLINTSCHFLSRRCSNADSLEIVIRVHVAKSQIRSSNSALIGLEKIWLMRRLSVRQQCAALLCSCRIHWSRGSQPYTERCRWCRCLSTRGPTPLPSTSSLCYTLRRAYRWWMTHSASCGAKRGCVLRWPQMSPRELSAL